VILSLTANDHHPAENAGGSLNEGEMRIRRMRVKLEPRLNEEREYPRSGHDGRRVAKLVGLSDSPPPIVRAYHKENHNDHHVHSHHSLGLGLHSGGG